ncbi:MAG: hypothetical protein Kow0026_09890 [Oricola sp.]
MQNPARLHSHSDQADTRDIRAELMELRRKAWETLLDLGLTEEEIAAYYGMGEEDPRQAALRQGMPVR